MAIDVEGKINTNKHKLADKWESTLYKVLKKMGDLPVYTVQPIDADGPSELYIETFCSLAVTYVSQRKLNSISQKFKGHALDVVHLSPMRRAMNLRMPCCSILSSRLLFPRRGWSERMTSQKR